MLHINYPLKLNMQNRDVGTLHVVLLKLGYTIDEEKKQEQPFGKSINQAIKVFQKDAGLSLKMRWMKIRQRSWKSHEKSCR